MVYGRNEAGKSTLHTFIRCMLFGLERGRGRARPGAGAGGGSSSHISFSNSPSSSKSARRGQKSSICEPSRDGRRDGWTRHARFPSSEKSTLSYPRITPRISTNSVHEAPIFEKKRVNRRRANQGERSAGHAWVAASAGGIVTCVSGRSSGKRTRPQWPRLRADRRRRRS